NCFPGGCGMPIATARLVAPLPGTLLMDMHYEAQTTNWSELKIGTPANPLAFHDFISCSPCSGDVNRIAIDVQGSEVVTFDLHDPEYFCSGDGVRCTFSNLQFVPATG